VIRLLLGELWALIVRREEKFEVVTPAAVAAVRGTEFLVKEVESATTLTVVSGQVEFRNPHGMVLTADETQSVATPWAAPTPPGRIGLMKVIRAPRGIEWGGFTRIAAPTRPRSRVPWPGWFRRSEG
jgi:hypothetical protein